MLIIKSFCLDTVLLLIDKPAWSPFYIMLLGDFIFYQRVRPVHLINRLHTSFFYTS